MTDAIQIWGNYGKLDVRADTGAVIEYEPDRSEPEHAYAEIVRFDLEEWGRTYPNETCEGGDILDFGYWYRRMDGFVDYEPPCEDWREEFRARLHQGLIEGLIVHL